MSIVQAAAQPAEFMPGEALPGASAADGPRMRVAHLGDFEPAHAVRASEHDDFMRRFTTLFIDDSTARAGGLGRVVRAANAQGESFAVKVLAEGSAPAQGDTGSGEAESEGWDAWREAAFDEEYAAHQALSGLNGFPRLYGRATLDGRPALVMEWVEGMTLAQAARELAVDGAGRLSPLTAARVGRDLFNLLTRMALTADGFAHRDISPANVMVDTSRLSVAQQAEEGSFELRLIDFGSAAASQRQRDRSLTTVYGAPRGATADFAAPELLTTDVAAATPHRKDPAVDVYAAAGVLYWLLCGRAPFDLDQRDGDGVPLSPYRVKTEGAMRAYGTAHQVEGKGSMLPLVLAREPEVAATVSRCMAARDSAPAQQEVAEALQAVDATLAPLLEGCLRADPTRRPSAATAHEALEAFCRHYGENVGSALAGGTLEPCIFPEPATSAPPARPEAMPAARLALSAVCAVAWLAVAVSAAALLGGAPVRASVGSLAWEGSLSAPACFLLLVLPGAAGIAARELARNRTSGRALVFGTAGIAAVAVALFALSLGAQASSSAHQLFGLALAAGCAAPWGLLVSQYVFGRKAAAPPARDALSPVSTS